MKHIVFFIFSFLIGFSALPNLQWNELRPGMNIRINLDHDILFPDFYDEEVTQYYSPIRLSGLARGEVLNISDLPSTVRKPLVLVSFRTRDCENPESSKQSHPLYSLQTSPPEAPSAIGNIIRKAAFRGTCLVEFVLEQVHLDKQSYFVVDN